MTNIAIQFWKFQSFSPVLNSKEWKMLNMHWEFPFHVGQEHQADTGKCLGGYLITFPDHQTLSIACSIHYTCTHELDIEMPKDNQKHWPYIWMFYRGMKWVLSASSSMTSLSRKSNDANTHGSISPLSVSEQPARQMKKNIVGTFSHLFLRKK